jgi:nitroimidazol reductase NimA-like FMN-containing flavoprotein (pyridoxamine 5'-phosphate oxidase superfamily)
MIKILKKKDNVQILERNYIGHLAYIYRDRPFIAPVTYFFDKENIFIIGYSSEGHKINAMRKNKEVSMEVSEIESVSDWNSVVVHGTFKELEGSDAKSYLHSFSLGVKDIILQKKHRELDFISQFSSKISKDDVPIVYIIKIDEITGRMRRY